MDVSTLIMFIVAAAMLLAGWISQAVWNKWGS